MWHNPAMAQVKKSSKRRKSSKRKSGVMTGMRGGFKNLADSVAGTKEKKKKSSSTWIGTALTIAIVVAAVAYFLSQR